VAGVEREPDDLALRAYLITVGGILAFCAVVFLFIL
jgi:hypothetical protein